MKKMTKILAAAATVAMVGTLLPAPAFAEGSYFVDNTYLVLQEGQTGTITISADNAAGRIDWVGSGTVTSEGYAFLDNGDGTITITADAVGTGYVTITPTDLETYDGEALNEEITITVEVVGAEGAEEAAADDAAPAPQAEEAAEEAPQNPEEVIPAEPAAGGEDFDGLLTDGNTDYADLPEAERLNTTVNGQAYTIVQFPIWAGENGEEIWNDAVRNLDRLNGFDRVTVNYKDTNVDCFRYQNLMQVFILQNVESGQTGYYVLENGVGFSPLSYVSVNGKQYIVVDFPADFVIPEGYQMVEMTLGTNTVHALKKIPENGAAPVAEEPDAADGQDEEAAADENAPEEEAGAEDTAEEVQDEAFAGPVDAAGAVLDAGADAAVVQAKEAFGVESALKESVAVAGAFKNQKKLTAVVDSRTKVMLKGYETEVSPGLDTEDPSDDLYYIYCLVDGKTQLYSYDAGEGTLQRASITVYHEIPTEPETVIVYETVPASEGNDAPAQPSVENEQAPASLKGIGWNNMQIQMKVLLIALGVAILLLIILIILFAAMSSKNKKKNRADDRKARRRAQRIPDREALPLDADDEDGFFSYVKTEQSGRNLKDLK